MYIVYGLYEPNGSLRYIGYTSKTLKERLKTHLGVIGRTEETHHRACWLRSLRSTGVKPTILELDRSTDLEEILQKEIYWIDYYRNAGVNLVNTASGGVGPSGHKWSQKQYERKSRKVHQYDKTGNLIATHNSLSDAAFMVCGDKKSNGKIARVCRGHRGGRSFCGFIFRYDGDSFNTHPVVGQWNITASQREMISQRQTLNNVMKNLTGSKNPRARAVIQLTRDREILQEFETITQARHSTGVTDISASLKYGVLRGGFLWEYKLKI